MVWSLLLWHKTLEESPRVIWFLFVGTTCIIRFWRPIGSGYISFLQIERLLTSRTQGSCGICRMGTILIYRARIKESPKSPEYEPLPKLSPLSVRVFFSCNSKPWSAGFARDSLQWLVRDLSAFFFAFASSLSCFSFAMTTRRMSLAAAASSLLQASSLD